MSILALAETLKQFALALKKQVEQQRQQRSLRDDQKQEQREYRNCLQLVEQLEILFETYCAVDAQEYQRFWVIVQSLMPGLHSWHNEQARHSTQIESVVARVRAMLFGLRRVIEQEIVVHYDVPEDLAQLARGWQQIADSIEKSKEVLPKVTTLESWQGQAANTYREMAKVQQAAIEEFEPLPAVMAKSYEQLGLLNRATLIAIYDSLRSTLQRISSPPQASLGRFYSRVCHFERELDDCLNNRLPDAILMIKARGETVKQEIDAACSSAKVISPKWPSGTSGTPSTSGAPSTAGTGWATSAPDRNVNRPIVEKKPAQDESRYRNPGPRISIEELDRRRFLPPVQESEQ